MLDYDADEMRVRDAVIGDLPAIVEIYNHAVLNSTATFDLEPTTVEEREHWFSMLGREHPLVVAESEGRVLGYAYYVPFRQRPAYRYTKETTVYVAADARGAGAGTALYAELIARARAAGVHALIAVVSGDNPASFALHEKVGFARVGHLREVGFKFGQWVDTRFFELLL